MPSTDATQERLQRTFAAQRRKDLLAMQTKDDLRALDSQTSQAPTSKEKLKVAKKSSQDNAVAKSTGISDAKSRRKRRLESRVKSKREKEAKSQAKEESTLDSALNSTSAGPKRPTEAERKAELAKTIKPTLAKTIRKGKLKKGNAKESKVVRKHKAREINATESGVPRKGKVRKLISKESGLVRKHKARETKSKESGVPRKVNNLVVRTMKGDSSPKRKESASTISKTPGFASLKNALIGSSTKSRNNIEKTDATQLNILRKIAVDTSAAKLILFSHSC